MSISNNNVASREISLRVEECYKEDTYKLIARVDPETLEELKAEIGDILLIQNLTKPRRKGIFKFYFHAEIFIRGGPLGI